MDLKLCRYLDYCQKICMCLIFSLDYLFSYFRRSFWLISFPEEFLLLSIWGTYFVCVTSPRGFHWSNRTLQMVSVWPEDVQVSLFLSDGFPQIFRSSSKFIYILFRILVFDIRGTFAKHRAVVARPTKVDVNQKCVYKTLYPQLYACPYKMPKLKRGLTLKTLVRFTFKS